MAGQAPEFQSGREEKTPAPASAESELARAYRPIMTGAALAIAAYLAFNALKRGLFSDGLEFLVLSSLSLLLALGAGGLYLAARRAVRLRELELIGIMLSGSVLLNVAIHLTISFEFENLVYFIIMMPVFGCMNTTRRAIALTVAASLACLVVFLQAYAPDQLLPYLSVSAAGMVAALAIAVILRRTVLEAIIARTEAVRDREIAEAYAEKARDAAERDALTRLPNRRTFFEMLEARIDRLARDGTPFLLGLVDLDGFKPVNDTYGHGAGDRVLALAAERLQALSPEGGSAARLGGDEFAVIGPAPENAPAAKVCGQALCDALSAPYELDDVVVRLSGSAGLVICDQAGLGAHELLERADYVLYQAKKGGRGEAVVFSARHETEMASSGRVDRALRDADFARELSLFFQPQFDLEHSRITGFEALARWNSPLLGPVMPHIFIPAAERANLIRALTETLFAKALDVLDTLPADLRLSFNLSAYDLMSDESVSRLVELLQQSGLASGRVEFEITETAMMADFAKARRSLDRLAAAGCSIAIDDFGVGYSNFGYLHELPVSKIKIDRSFVGRLLQDQSAAKIVKTLISLARSLDMECVIEGVEDEDQLETLKACQARIVQGYLFGMPMPADDIEAFLESAPARWSRIDSGVLPARTVAG